MYRYLLLVLLAVSVSSNHKDDYFLSPALPPTAFVGQYYTTQFRVLGLDNPLFKFEDLPSCLKGHVDGTLEGTPDKAGSYSAFVCFSTSSVSLVRTKIVIRVANSVASTQGLNTRAGVLADNQFIVVNSGSSFVYKADASINLALKAQNGKAPLTWSYINLPDGLKGDQSGKITGALKDNGYYSFNAVCSDASGQSINSYYTLNVQPKTVVSSSNLIDVPSQNVPLQYNIAQVENQTIQAEKAVYAAIKVVNQEQIEVNQSRVAQAKTALALQFAQTQDNSAVAKVNDAKVTLAAAQKASSKAQVVLTGANQVVALATTNANNAIKGVNFAQKALADATNAFNEANQHLKKANNAFINAQTKSSQAAQNAKAAITAALNAQNVYNLAFNAFSKAKQALSDAQDQLRQANSVVDMARNALNLANQVNDNAQAALTSAQNDYNKAYSALNNANVLVAQISARRDQAQTDLGTAAFNLQQANNNLFVAQARKEQSDKATSIVKAQSTTLPAPGSTSTYIFSGCEQQAFPTVWGTDIVRQANSLGYTLNSGKTLLYGSCTGGVQTHKVGDVVSYVGYLRNGYYHATNIQRFNY